MELQVYAICMALDWVERTKQICDLQRLSIQEPNKLLKKNTQTSQLTRQNRRERVFYGRKLMEWPQHWDQEIRGGRHLIEQVLRETGGNRKEKAVMTRLTIGHSNLTLHIIACNWTL